MVSYQSGVSKSNISLNTAINNELGIHGEDWVEILERLKKDHDCELHGLVFYDYFMDESQISVRLTFRILYLPIRVLGLVVLYLFNRNKGIIFWKRDPFKKYPDLTVGDLITSIVMKRWMPRNQLKIVMK